MFPTRKCGLSDGNCLKGVGGGGGCPDENCLMGVVQGGNCLKKIVQRGNSPEENFAKVVAGGCKGWNYPQECSESSSHISSLCLWNKHPFDFSPLFSLPIRCLVLMLVLYMEINLKWRDQASYILSKRVSFLFWSALGFWGGGWIYPKLRWSSTLTCQGVLKSTYTRWGYTLNKFKLMM